jgi:P27 family predicted phage terminase small subunit
VPARPAFLSGAAAEEWERVVPQLVAAGVATEPHTASLTAMCVFWGVAEQARQVYEQAGLVEEGSMGQMVEHPMLRAYHASVAAYMRIAVEFGLTASAAMRIEQAKGEPEPFAEIGPSPRLRRVK